MVPAPPAARPLYQDKDTAVDIVSCNPEVTEKYETQAEMKG